MDAFIIDSFIDYNRNTGVLMCHASCIDIDSHRYTKIRLHSLPQINYILWVWKNKSPQNSPMCPSSVQLCRENWIYVVAVMLSRWLLTGGIWANLREQGDFLLLLWFPLIQDYTKTPRYSNYHTLHDHRIHQLINFNTIFIEDIIAFFFSLPPFSINKLKI